MIDVVFLLLVFFMLAARFGSDFTVPLQLAGGGSGYSGPPRIIDVLPKGVRLNGVDMDQAQLATELERLTEDPSDALIFRARDGAVLQRMIDEMEMLEELGFATMVIVE